MESSLPCAWLIAEASSHSGWNRYWARVMRERVVGPEKKRERGWESLCPVFESSEADRLRWRERERISKIGNASVG